MIGKAHWQAKITRIQMVLLVLGLAMTIYGSVMVYRPAQSHSVEDLFISVGIGIQFIAACIGILGLLRAGDAAAVRLRVSTTVACVSAVVSLFLSPAVSG